MDARTIYVSGNNLVCHFTEADSAGAGIDGLTTKFSIFNRANSKYWDDASSDFDSAAEVLNTADVDAVKSALGLYEYILVGGVALGGSLFQMHVESTQFVTGDIADFAVVNDNVVELQTTVDTILGAIAADMRNLLDLSKKHTKMELDLRLLIAATERLKKGRL